MKHIALNTIFKKPTCDHFYVGENDIVLETLSNPSDVFEDNW